MLHSAKKFRDYRLAAADEAATLIGGIADLLFDDRTLETRYFVVDTGSWLPGRRVVISPQAITRVAPEGEVLHTELDAQSVEESPSIEEHEPVSRKHQRELAAHYGWSPFVAYHPIAGAALPTPAAAPMGARPETTQEEPVAESHEKETHLRSLNETLGYAIAATDGELGHAEDFICDTTGWRFKHLIVDTRNLFPGGRKVLIPVDLIESVSWPGRTLSVSITTEQIKNSPTYDPDRPVNAVDELRLYDYYGRPVY